MDTPPSPSFDEYRDAVQCFRQAREANIRKDFLGREFVLVQAVTDAVLDSLQPLLETAYARHNRSIPQNKHTELHSCLPIFYTLLDLDEGHLIHHFRESDAHKLPIELNKLDSLFFSDQFGDFARRFYTAQWKWCPMEFDYRMGIRLSDAERIVPITKRRKIEPARDSIPKPDRKATLWVVEVPSELVSGHLKEMLQDNDEDHTDAEGSDNGSAPQSLSTWRMVVKQFSKTKKDEFDRERDLFNTLGEKPGIVQYLGWFENREPASPGSNPENQEPDVFYNLVLELGDQDLYSAFQKENPPTHFQEIRLFWRSLFDVADALASIQTIQRSSFTDYVWHGDIKPENILDVETGFKLADPGEAVVVKVGNGEQTDIKSLRTRVPGGTRTFAAPEKTAYTSGDPEPEVTQGIDIWSLGCVFSVAATYVVLGKEGVKQYRLFRQRAVKAVRQGGGYSFGDSFHDGCRVLPEVTLWHQLLVACLRKDDAYTAKVLEIVDQKMLIVPGDERITGAELSIALRSIHENAGQHSPTEVPQEILDFLTDELGPSRTRQSDLEDVPRTISQSGTEMFEEALLYASRTSEGRPVRRQPQHGERLYMPEHAPYASTSAVPQNAHTRPHQIGQINFPRLQIPETPFPEEMASQPKEPPTTMWEVEAHLNRWGVSKKLLGGKKKQSVYGVSMGGKPDRLENHFANRDIVYLVDNASSMANVWGHVTYLLRVLVWRSLHYDDDGMELKFTIGSNDLNLEPHKKQKVDDFVKKMEIAAPKPHQAKGTDMSASLSLILEEHIRKYRNQDRSRMRRKLTILVLTDGLWTQNTEYEVDDYLVNCIQKIPDVEWRPDPNNNAGTGSAMTGPRKPPSRPISIQFIRFGDNEKAIERLDRLDNQLQHRLELEARALPDVIDTESANGDIYKMFLGSVLEDFDNKPIQGAAVVTSPTISRQSSFLHPSRQSVQSAPLSAPPDYHTNTNPIGHIDSGRSPSRSPSNTTQRPRSVTRQQKGYSAPMLMTNRSSTNAFQPQMSDMSNSNMEASQFGGGNYLHRNTPNVSPHTVQSQYPAVPRTSSNSFVVSDSRSSSAAYKTSISALENDYDHLRNLHQSGHHSQEQHQQAEYYPGYYRPAQN